MAQVLVRNLDDDVVATLKAASKAQGRSFEAYARDTLTAAAHRERRMAALAESDKIREEDRLWREQSGLPPEAFQTAVELVRWSRDES